MSSNCPCFLLQLAFLEMLHVSHVINGRLIHILHPSNRVSCSLLELSIKSSILSALARQWSFTGSPFFVFRFVSKFFLLHFSLSLFVSLQKKKVGDGIWTLTLWVCSRLLTPKTTVPWRTHGTLWKFKRVAAVLSFPVWGLCIGRIDVWDSGTGFIA